MVIIFSDLIEYRSNFKSDSYHEFVVLLLKTKRAYHLKNILLHLSEQLFFDFICFAFNFSHALHLNSQLVKVLRKKKGIYQLKFRKTLSINGNIMSTKHYFFVYSRNVILAIPKVPILKIQMPQSSNPRFLSALNSVVDVQSSKIFLIYNYPWWLGGSHNFTYTQSDLPYRQSCIIISSVD